jgi:hypothetical protein
MVGQQFFASLVDQSGTPQGTLTETLGASSETITVTTTDRTTLTNTLGLGEQFHVTSDANGILLIYGDPQEIIFHTTGSGASETIESNAIDLTVNLGNGNDTIGPMGPGSVINAGQGKDIFTVSNDILIAGTGGNTKDEIVADGQVIHGFVGPINSDSPWITSIYNGISYGLNSEGQLAIKDTLGNITYVAGYTGGTNVPLSQQTDGIFVGRGSLKSSRLADLKRPAIEEDANVFKFANEIAYVRLGHPEYPGNDDPLVLDLSGNGVNLTGETSVSPMFDMNGTGFAVHTGWIQPGTGLLVLQDANGNVENINQLVGGENSSGFAALAQYDANHDGVIDANDPIYAQLRVWQDANSNGVVDPGELETLAQAGITSIGVTGTAQTGLSIAANAVNATGIFTRSDGTTGAIDDVSFTIDPFHSRYLGNTTVSAAAAALPNLKGYGTLTDLQVAMTIDPALNNPTSGPTFGQPFGPTPTLIDVVNENLPNLDQLDLTALRTAAMPIFDAWARAVQLPDANGNLHTVDPASGHQDVPVLLDTDATGATIVDDFAYQFTDPHGTTYYKLASGNDVKDAQGNVIAQPTFADVMAQTSAKGQWTDFTADQIGFMERYLGHPLPIDSTGSDSGALIDVMSKFISASYEAMNLEAVRLAMQGPLNQYFPTIVYDATTDHFHATTDDQLAPMYEAIFNAAPADAAGAAAWLTAWKPVIDVVLGDFDRGQGQPVSYAYQFASMVHAYEASHLPLSIVDAAVALGVPQGEVVAGGATLTGTDAAQIFYLSGGDQTVNDTHSSQNFVMGGNFGHDVINAEQTGVQEQDVLRFTNVKSTDVTASRNGIDLTLTVNGTGQSIFLPGEFTGVRPGFIGVGNLNPLFGVSEIVFSDGVVWGMPDIAWAVAEHTTATNDTLLGTGAMDVLDARFAHYLSGGDGGDVYLFGPGDGHVTINAARTDVLALNPDVVVFGPGITASDLTFSRQGDSLDLNIAVNGTGDGLTILGQFAGSPNIFGATAWFNRIEEFKFADGSSLSWDDIIRNLEAQEPTSGQTQIYGFVVPDFTGDGFVADTLDGGPGVHYLSGENGDHDYIFDFNHAYDVVQNNAGNANFPSDETLLFGPTVTPKDVTFSRFPGDISDLIITLSDGSTMVVDGQYNVSPTNNTINTFQFADGTTLTAAQVLQQLISQEETAPNQIVAGSEWDETLDGAAGNEYLSGLNTFFFGQGFTNTNTYVFGHGYGQETIDAGFTSTSIVSFKPDVTPNDVTWSALGSDLVVRLKDSGDSITVLGGLGFTTINTFQFVDGTTLSNSDVLNMVLNASGGGETLLAEDIGYKNAPAKVIQLGPGDTVIGDGGQSLQASGGDVYDFNPGDGRNVILDQGNNTIAFGAGITASMVRVDLMGSTVVFSFPGSQDQIVFTDTTYGGGSNAPFSAIGQVNFADGTSWSTAELLAQAQVDPALQPIQNGNGTEYDYDIADGFRWVQQKNFADTAGSTTTVRVSGIAPTDVELQAVGVPGSGSANAAGVLLTSQGSTAGGLLLESTGGTILPFDQLVFDDGTVWTRSEVEQLLVDRQSAAAGGKAIYAYGDDETLSAGVGTDLLTAGSGAETFIYARGDGDTEIQTNPVTQIEPNAGDTLVLQGIASTDVTLARLPATPNANLASNPNKFDDLIIYVNAANGQPGGKITILDQFDPNANAGINIDVGGGYTAHQPIGNIVFSDGVVWTQADIESKVLAQEESQNGDGGILYGSNDLTTTLTAGTGAEVLTGISGHDTYVWSAGDGPTVIDGVAVAAFTLVNNTLDIKGVAPADVTVSFDPTPGKDIHNLVLTIPGQDPIILENQTEGHNAASIIDRVVFDDGTMWDYSDLVLFAGGGIPTTPNGTTARAFDGTPATATLVGTSSNDTYFWGVGDGNDTIAEIGADPWAKADVLRLVGLNPGDVTFQIVENNGPDLRITNKATGETLTVTAQFFGASHDGSDSNPGFGYGIEKVIFADGTEWNAEQILQNSSYVAAPGNNTVFNLDLGNGTVPIDASPGVTLLQGIGGDTFVWQPGDGNDSILNFGKPGAPDTLREVGVNPAAVLLQQSGSSLLITRLDTGNVTTVQLEFAANTPDAGLDQIVFDNGTVWNRAYINAAAAAAPPPIIAYITGTSPPPYDTSNLVNGQVVYNLGTGTFGNVNVHHDQLVKIIWGAGDSSQQFTIDGNGNGENTASLVLNNLNPSDVSFYRSGPSLTDLTIANKATGKALTFYNEFVDAWDGVASVTFANGTTWQQATIAGNSYITAASSTSGSYDTFFIFNYPIIYVLGTGTFGNVNASKIGAVEVIWGAGDSSQQFTINGNGNNQNSGSLVLNGLNPSDVSFYRSGTNFADLTIANKTTGATLRLPLEFQDAWDGVASVTFANGTTWQQATIAANSYITAASSASGSYDTFFIFNYPIIYDLGTGTFGNVNASKIGAVEVIWGAGDSSQQFTINGNGNNQNSGSLVLNGLNPSDVSFYRSGTNLTDLTIANKATGKALTFYNEFVDAWDGVASVTFANGTTWQQATVAANSYITAASSASGSYDTFFVFNYPIIYDLGTGTFGNINASKIGAVEVIWGAGDSSQAFTINGNGNNQNSGSLVLNGLNPSGVSFYRSGASLTDLTIANKATGKTLTFYNEFQNPWNGVASVTFGNGTTWQASTIAANTYITAASSTSGSYDTANLFNQTTIYDLGTGTFGNVNAHHDQAVEVIWGAGDSSEAFTIDGDGNGNNTGSLVLNGLNASDVSFYRSGPSFTDLTIANKATGKTFTFYNEFQNPWNGVASVTFGNGTTWQASTIAANTYITAASSTSGSYDTAFLFNQTTIYDLGAGTFGNVNVHHDQAVEVIWGAGDSSEAFTIDGDGNGNNTGALILNNLTPSDVAFYRSGSNLADLTVANRATGTTLTFYNEFSSSWWGVASVTFANGTVWQASTIAANAGARPPTLTAQNASGSEDQSTALSISPIEVDPNGSLSLTISGIPADATLSNSQGALSVANGSVTFSSAQLAAGALTGLAITPTSADEPSFALNVTATTTDGTLTGSTSGTINVTVSPHADAPSLTVQNASGTEAQPIALSIGPALAESGAADPDAALSVTISGIPAGASLSNSQGALTIANGSITFTPAQLAAGALNGLAITPASDANFALAVTATAQDGTSSATATATAPVTVAPLAPTVTISGTAQEGQTLTAAASTGDGDVTLGYQWQSSSDGQTWSNISGAAGSTYTAQESDEGFFLRVAVTATDSQGNSTAAASAATAAVIDIAPTLSVTVSGTAQEGQVLTANAIANDADAVVTYQWQSFNGTAWSNIAGATNATYTAQESDEGSPLRAVAISTDADGSGTTATSTATAAVVDIAPTLSVTISGAAQEGQRLSASAVADDSDAIITYQWQSFDGTTWSNIAGVTASTYTPAEADEGNQLRVAAISTDPDGSGTSATSAATAAVVDIAPSLSVTISGTAQEGQTLSAAAVANDADAVVTYQWQSFNGTAWSNISGATGSTYTAAEADEGSQLRVVATSTDSDGSGTSATSAATAAVIDIAPTLSVTVSGTAQEGQVLTANAIANDADAVVTYQWQSFNGTAWSNIAGATNATYTAQESDEGSPLRAVAISTDADGSGTTATSTATAAVVDIAPTLSVTISGAAQEGQRLSASAVADDSDAIITYQWQSFDGTTWSNIAGATASTYTPAEADEGNQLRVAAISTDPDGSGTTATGGATTAVVDITPTLSVTVSGAAQEGQTLTAAAVANDADAVVTYQWQSFNGTAWSNIAGATNATYTAAEADEGHPLRVVATSTDSDGSGTTANSAATGSVIDIAPTLSVTVSGTAQEGQTLTANATANDADAVVAYQWQSLTGSAWSNISGATNATYTAAEADEGHQLRVVATSTDSDGSGTTANSAATGAVVDIAPTLSVTISGTAQEGQALTANAIANDADAVVAYQWQSLTGSTWSNISGATNATYTAAEADEGHQLRVVATSTDSDGSGTSATSAATAAVADITPTLSVTISGTAQEGQTLTANPIANDADAVVTYQWQSLSGSTWSNISGATAATYTAAEADEGHQLRVVATSTDSDGSGTSATSAATAAVIDIAPSLSVTVGGTAQEGQSQTANAVANDSDAVVTYQWQSLSGSTWSNISGATAATYTAAEADEGHQLRVVATSTDSDGSGTSATSAATAAVVDITPTLSVTISGTAQEGQTLTANAVANDSDAVVTYQWQSLSGSTWSNISGATSSTFLVGEANEGHQLRVVATSTDGDGSGTSAISAATAAVIDIAPTLTVSVSGTAQEGKTLTASAVANDSDAVITYQWQSLSGSTWSNISGATSSTYMAVEVDEGHQLRVVATSSDSDGSGTSANSAATAAVMDVTPTLTVSVSGTAQEGKTLTATAQATSDADGGTTTYQWQSLTGTTWSSISGATASTYTAAEVDEGHQLRVSATFVDDTGQSVTATSSATAVVTDIAPTLSVTVSGTAKEGQTLTATAVANDADAVISYQWQSLSGSTWSNISGATAATYLVVEANETHQLRVVATSTDSDGSGTSATSAATAAVTDIAPTLSVTVSGTAQEGQTLTATAVANDSDVVIKYQWQSLSGSTWSNISGAAASTYKIAESNEGHQLRVVATSTDSDGSGTSANSAATAAVTDAPPTLTISNHAITVAAGGSVALPITEATSDTDDVLTLTIAGLTSYETITDKHDSTVFSGSSVTLTSAEVASGLTLHSSYTGTGHPVNTLTVTANNTTSGEAVSSASQTITVTDPPPSSPAPTADVLWPASGGDASGVGRMDPALTLSAAATDAAPAPSTDAILWTSNDPAVSSVGGSAGTGILWDSQSNISSLGAIGRTGGSPYSSGATAWWPGGLGFGSDWPLVQTSGQPTNAVLWRGIDPAGSAFAGAPSAQANGSFPLSMPGAIGGAGIASGPDPLMGRTAPAYQHSALAIG